MKTILPLYPFKHFIAALLLFASFFTQAQSGPQLVFMNPVLKSGTENKQGAIYRFSNVANGVDAELKLKKFSRPDIVMENVDLPDLGWEKALQPKFGLAGNIAPNQNWYIDFELFFYKSGTMTRQKMDTVDLTALDVDGDGASLSEYVTFDNPSSIVYSTVSYLTNVSTGLLGQSFECDQCHSLSILINCLGCGGDGLTNSGSGNNNECPDCEGSGKVYLLCHHPYEGVSGNTVNGPVNNFNNIDTTATQVMATYQYLKRDGLKFRYGAKTGSGGGGGGNSGVRLNSTWFRSFSLAPMNTLPVKLISFNAMLNNNKADLSWKTAVEINTSHFVVEKSTDGINFKEAGIVFAYGNSADVQNYSFTDNSLTASITYYRLRSVDIDQKSEYSDIRIIKLSKQTERAVSIVTYPNPASNELRVTIPTGWQGKKISYQILDNHGRIIIKTEPTNSSQTETINVANLAPGIYMASVTCNGESATQKIIKR